MKDSLAIVTLVIDMIDVVGEKLHDCGYFLTSISQASKLPMRSKRLDYVFFG